MQVYEINLSRAQMAIVCSSLLRSKAQALQVALMFPNDPESKKRHTDRAASIQELLRFLDTNSVIKELEE